METAALRMVLNRNNTITAVPGIQVGHAQDLEALTGCTVIICKTGAVAGVDQRGGAPGTRETDLLRPMHMVEQVHAVLLTGGSAYGLEAAGGVMRYLEENQVGFNMPGVGVVPIVPAAVIFDLALGRPEVRPDAAMGYRACQAASGGPVGQGNAGAGAGATIGKILGMPQAVKSGLGSASLVVGEKLVVGALVVVNALGEVRNPADGTILAGARGGLVGGQQVGATGEFIDTLEVMKQMAEGLPAGSSMGNTVIGVVATNAQLSKEGCNKVAQMAQDGVARTIYPAHTMFDGDTLFALATGEVPADVSLVGALAAEATAQAILQAVRLASGAGGLPALRDLSE
jgi:L-aminopeptidase/D-esterase-like protein